MFDDTDAAWLLDVLATRWMHDQGTPNDAEARRDAAMHLRYFIDAYQHDTRLRLPRNGEAMAAIRRVLTHHNADFVRVTMRAETCVPDYVAQDVSWVLVPTHEMQTDKDAHPERAALCVAGE